MQSLAMVCMSKLERLLRKSGVLTEDILVDSNGLDPSVSPETSENTSANSSSLSDETSLDSCGDPVIPSPLKWVTIPFPQLCLYCTL